MSAASPHSHVHGRCQYMMMLLLLIESSMRPQALFNIISGNGYHLMKVGLQSKTYIPS